MRLTTCKHASKHSDMAKDTATAMRSKGGKSRWKGKNAKERTEEMRRVAKLGWRKRHRGFTMVEVVIAVAILGLLGAMAVMAFNRTRAQKMITTSPEMAAERFTATGDTRGAAVFILKDKQTGAEYLVVEMYQQAVAVTKLEAK